MVATRAGSVCSAAYPCSGGGPRLCTSGCTAMRSMGIGVRRGLPLGLLLDGLLRCAMSTCASLQASPRKKHQICASRTSLAPPGRRSPRGPGGRGSSGPACAPAEVRRGHPRRPGRPGRRAAGPARSARGAPGERAPARGPAHRASRHLEPTQRALPGSQRCIGASDDGARRLSPARYLRADKPQSQTVHPSPRLPHRKRPPIALQYKATRLRPANCVRQRK